MTVALLRHLDRLETYTARARASVELEDYAQAMADAAEVYYLAMKLWEELQKANIQKETE